MQHGLDDALARIREIPDYPTPGVVFRDLTPLFGDGTAYCAVVDALAEPFAGQFDFVAGLEARGFLLAGGIARATGAGIVTVRKAGKLPRHTVHAAYELEYGTAAIEAHVDSVPAGARVLLVDDVLATGGTLCAAQQLGEQLGWQEAGIAVVLELEELGGRARLAGSRIHALASV